MTEVEKVDEEGQICYFIKGTHIFHREDGPAFLMHPGGEIWYRYGKYHREDGPAFISIGGTKEWWINGKIHRDDGPAKEYRTGKKEWYLNGQYFDSKESWFEALTEEQKSKALYSEYFIRG
jgi:hypothetical protein